MSIFKKIASNLKRKTYVFYDQETGDGTILELKGSLKGGFMQIQRDGQLIDIQIKNIYKSKHENRVNYVQVKKIQF